MSYHVKFYLVHHLILFIEQNFLVNGYQFLPQKSMVTSFFTQRVHEATRADIILDLNLSTEPDMVDEVEIGCLIAKSDHNVIMFNQLCS